MQDNDPEKGRHTVGLNVEEIQHKCVVRVGPVAFQCVSMGQILFVVEN